MLLRIVTGGRDAGKTAWVKEHLAAAGGVGFLQEKVFAKGVEIGYDLVPVGLGGERMALARAVQPGGVATGPAAGSHTPAPGPPPEDGAPRSDVRTRWFRFRRFYFSQAAFDQAESLAAELLTAGRGGVTGAGTADRGDTLGGRGLVLLLDEVGPLEVEGRGFCDLFTRFLETPWELTVTTRPALVEWVRQRSLRRRVEVVALQ